MNEKSKPTWEIKVNDHGCYTTLRKFRSFGSCEECEEKIRELKKMSEFKKDQLILRAESPESNWPQAYLAPKPFEHLPDAPAKCD
jgi:hypothetical protein